MTTDQDQADDAAPAELVALARRLRDAVRAAGGPNDPAKDYAALYAEQKAAVGRIVRWADRHEKEQGHAG